MAISVLKKEFVNGLDKLTEIGVEREVFIQAVEAGYFEYTNSTVFHPKTNAGYRAWSETVAAIRKALTLKGWKIIDNKNVPLMFNKELNISIGVSSGDKNTGTKNIPCTKNSKGSVTKKIVNKNFDLFDDYLVEEVEAPLDSHLHYLLLYYFDIDKQEARFELSIPVSFSFNDRISEWSFRHIFDLVSFNDEISLDVDSSDSPEEIDFDIFLKDA